MDKIVGDMYLAATYLSHNVPLQNIDRSRKRLKFVFSSNHSCSIVVVDENGEVKKLENQTLDDIEIKFVEKSLMFPPSYPESVRRIKATIHAEDENG